MSVNKVIIIGNLGQDPDLKHASNGNPVCRLSVATTRTWKNKQTQEKQQETEWHRVTVWGQQAEHCSEYLSKGRQVYVEGYLRTSSYEKDGDKRFSTEIIAEQVQFLGGKPHGDSGEERSGHRESDKSRGKAKASKGYDEDDDIPF